ncbi:DUF4752 family protein [Symbiopectobacterium purcellii]|uniref:DUF4752 family protein n=1 Tax=Symbiopectobacterium purcellii TaxID=2871826 RepID=A0ABX9ARH9_9ENTR|nr:DUF4752 family protein [Symbiopectobacterium purcellii]QZN97810.1 DUF4752 family protein [Symbiopectobacterium purcellii]
MSEWAEYLNTGLALLGWLYIMVKAGEWLTSTVLKKWCNRRKESRKQKAVNELYDAFQLDQIKDGQTLKVTTKGSLTIMMVRSERP